MTVMVAGQAHNKVARSSDDYVQEAIVAKKKIGGRTLTASQKQARIDKIMADPELAKKMGQAGYERARDVFSWESIGDKTVEVYQSVLDEQKK